MVKYHTLSKLSFITEREVISTRSEQNSFLFTASVPVEFSLKWINTRTGSNSASLQKIFSKRGAMRVYVYKQDCLVKELKIKDVGQNMSETEWPPYYNIAPRDNISVNHTRCAGRYTLPEL